VIRRLRIVSSSFCDWVFCWLRFRLSMTIFHSTLGKYLILKRLLQHICFCLNILRPSKQKQNFLFRFFLLVWKVHGNLFDLVWAIVDFSIQILIPFNLIGIIVPFPIFRTWVQMVLKFCFLNSHYAWQATRISNQSQISCDRLSLYRTKLKKKLHAHGIRYDRHIVLPVHP